MAVYESLLFKELVQIFSLIILTAKYVGISKWGKSIFIMHKQMYDWDRLATGAAGNKFDFTSHPANISG